VISAAEMAELSVEWSNTEATAMASYNKVLLMGNLTRDIELKYTPTNQPVATFGLAMNRRYRTKEGDDREETTFVDCDAWGRTAEVMNQYLAKGKPVFIEGRLKLDQWENQQGEKRSKLKVVVENFQFIDSKGGGGGGAGAANAPQAAPAAAGGTHQPISEDDIPF
jgi:single-strand DNA-binding protein